MSSSEQTTADENGALSEKLSLSECRRYLSNLQLTDTEILDLRDMLYVFCESILDDELAASLGKDQNGCII
jgi:hypothetical protein